MYIFLYLTTSWYQERKVATLNKMAATSHKMRAVTCQEVNRAAESERKWWLEEKDPGSPLHLFGPTHCGYVMCWTNV